jgi:hypothetical protein
MDDTELAAPAAEPRPQPRRRLCLDRLVPATPPSASDNDDDEQGEQEQHEGPPPPLLLAAAAAAAAAEAEAEHMTVEDEDAGRLTTAAAAAAAAATPAATAVAASGEPMLASPSTAPSPAPATAAAAPGTCIHTPCYTLPHIPRVLIPAPPTPPKIIRRQWKGRILFLQPTRPRHRARTRSLPETVPGPGGLPPQPPVPHRGLFVARAAPELSRGRVCGGAGADAPRGVPVGRAGPRDGGAPE